MINQPVGFFEIIFFIIHETHEKTRKLEERTRRVGNIYNKFLVKFRDFRDGMIKMQAVEYLVREWKKGWVQVMGSRFSRRHYACFRDWLPTNHPIVAFEHE